MKNIHFPPSGLLIVKKVTATILTIFSLLIMNSCRTNGIELDERNVITQTRDLGSFNRFEVHNGFEVTLVQGATESITIEAPEAYLPYIHIKIQNGTLILELDDNIDEDNHAHKKAILTFKTLRGIDGSGGSYLTCNDSIVSSDFDIDLSGGSECHLTLGAETLTFETSGGSEMTLALSAEEIRGGGSGGSVLFLSGHGKNFRLRGLSGGSIMRAFSLQMAQADLELSGGSIAELTVLDALTVSASGGSAVRYKGNPTITEDLSGGSSIQNAN